MKVIAKTLFSLLFLLFLIYFLPGTITAAQPEFSSVFFSKYTIEDDARVLVRQTIQIKNKLANVYVSEYSLTIGSNQLRNIIVSNELGVIVPRIDVGPNKTTITIPLSDKIVGKDKTLFLNLSYETSDFASKNGKILEVGVPSVSRQNQFDDYSVQIVIPSRFGPPSFILPSPSQISKQGNLILYDFDRASLQGAEGISAAFGDSQIYRFRLRYELQNPEDYRLRTQITLPPDTTYQRLSYESLQPPPLSVTADKDGNWLATYELEKKQNVTIEAAGTAVVYLVPQPDLADAVPSEDDLKKYLEPQKYWETRDAEVIKLAQTLKKPYKIYDYVSKNLIYDYGRLDKPVQRLGAAQALANKNSAVCTEFTDLFIALCRANGIAAREIDGYAYTVNSSLRPLSLKRDILHSWPEYYDPAKNTWIPVDPTWGSTTGGIDFFNKLDLNHLAFVKHGLKSDFPPPPGAFTLDPNKKTVSVEFAETQTGTKSAEITVNVPEFSLAGITVLGNATVTNNGQMGYHQELLTVDTNGDKKQYNSGNLPPYSAYSIPVSLKTGIMQKESLSLEASFSGIRTKKTVQILPLPAYIVHLFKLWINRLRTS